MKIERKTSEIDATNKPLGRLAVEVVLKLRGKDNPGFLPHIDAGDFVVVKNVKNIKFSGRKFDKKMYFSHSGYIGSDRKTSLAKIFTKDPSKILRRAVLGMLPKNRLRAQMIKRLKIEV